MQRRRRSGSAPNLIGLIVERNSVSISPNAPQLERLDVAALKSKKIKLRLASGKIDNDRLRRTDALPANAKHADIGQMNENESVPQRQFPKKMNGLTST